MIELYQVINFVQWSWDTIDTILKNSNHNNVDFLYRSYFHLSWWNKNQSKKFLLLTEEKKYCQNTEFHEFNWIWSLDGILHVCLWLVRWRGLLYLSKIEMVVENVYKVLSFKQISSLEKNLSRSTRERSRIWQFSKSFFNFVPLESIKQLLDIGCSPIDEKKTFINL